MWTRPGENYFVHTIFSNMEKTIIFVVYQRRFMVGRNFCFNIRIKRHFRLEVFD